VNKENKYIACPLYVAALLSRIQKPEVCDATEAERCGEAGYIIKPYAKRVAGKT